ncbi:MAG: hypothetical protein RLZZ628_230 [Bacteroidota bacterium]|jgi:hypothetical protein
MQKIGLLTAFVALLLTNNAFAQREQTLFKNAGGLSGVWAGMNYYGAGFGEKYGTYQGGFWGLEFGKTLLIGGNHYQINNERLNNKNNTTNTFSLQSNGLLLNYAITPSKAVHPNLSLVASRATLKLNDGTTDKVFTLEPTIGVEANVLRWCHVSVNAGYRFVADNKLVGFNDTDFSGAFAEAKLKFGWSWGHPLN